MDDTIKFPQKSVRGDKRRLSSACDLRLFLASIIRAVESGKIDESKGRCLGYLSQVLLRTIEGGELEKRIETLEEKILKGA